jgi:carboxypeptidase Taq
MNHDEKAEAELLERWGKIHDLGEAQQLLEWDQQTMMPRKGGEQRAAQLSTLAEDVHQRICDPRIAELCAELEARGTLAAGLAADVREARRAHERAVRVPAALVAERTRICALAQRAWEEARPRNDFASFRPHLERVVELTRELARCIRPEAPYDALLDEYEPGMTQVELAALFGSLKGEVTRLLDRIRGSRHGPEDSVLRRRYPIEAQRELCRRLCGAIGFDLEAGRLDISAHPFTCGTLHDVRITTRYDERYLPNALCGTMHEGGHGLYEQGLDPARLRHPSGGHCSLGIHESQSRFWENVIGRSRAFWTHYLPELRGSFPGVLDEIDVEGFFRALNCVRPSLIRVDADEVTYALHIILRFELEAALLGSELEARDLPEAWREGMRATVGIAPTDDRDGVLQDVHWSAGLIGYFPTYTLGNLYAAAFWEALRRALPEAELGIARGELAPIREWLRVQVHARGRLLLAQDLCAKVTGQPLSIQPFVHYLEEKYREIYRL